MKTPAVASAPQPFEKSRGCSVEEIAERIRTLDRILSKKRLEVEILRDLKASLVARHRDLSAQRSVRKRNDDGSLNIRAVMP
jgi:hypothetical protein